MKKYLVAVGFLSSLALMGCESQPEFKSSDSGYDRHGGHLIKTEAKNSSSALSDGDIQRLANAILEKQKTAESANVGQLRSLPSQVIITERRSQERIKITGVGFGAENNFDGFTDGQRRLMAIRASKLDAYRALAEQIYGIKIDSNTSVATLTAQNDSFRARVNAVVRGARIVSITPMADNNYETVLEVFVDRDFFEDVFVYTGQNKQRILEPLDVCTIGFNCYDAANYR
ncbi:LPP20 family lipoprotein [Thiomicrospira sp. R3]|uniref:LPP20 family lipoprotein n=1 Tax=Thiomicrospira sp. R3 TaxID=3035472 RepID=UPI00259B3C58|nr:LPP20 family lipoprotein [Thiomicrospira sp. R3]WFE69007.1 LPP20 family lipoprotein [Thiomicrospira sp. R3]